MSTTGKIDQAIYTLLDDLMTKDRDATEGYLKAAENIKERSAREMLLRYSNQRGRFVAGLKEEINRLGGEFADRTSFLSSMHRVWMDIQGTISGKDPQTILSECLRGEEAALKDYQEASENKFLPKKTKELIQNHIEKIESSIKELNDWLNDNSDNNQTTMKVEDMPVEIIAK